MIDLTFLMNYVSLEILAICLVIGFIVKNSTPIKNKFIPAIVTVLGLILSIATNGFGLPLNIAVQGLMSGILSIGLHSTFKEMLKKNNNK